MPISSAMSGLLRVALTARPNAVNRRAEASSRTSTAAVATAYRSMLMRFAPPISTPRIFHPRSPLVCEPHTMRMKFSRAMSRPSAATKIASSALLPARAASGR